MARVFITGTTDGLGLAAARLLVEQGHTVIGHARNERRAQQLRERLPEAETVLAADLSSRKQTVRLAEQANELDPFDAVIHNAGVGYRERAKITTEDGHAHVLAINVLAPYILTSLMHRPKRLVYLSSGMHQGGRGDTRDLDWERRPWNGSQAYSDSKLYDATLAFAVARLWPEVLSNSLEPGWVPTKMGGPGAPDDITQAHITQAWLAVSEDPEAKVTGQYFYHQKEVPAALAALDTGFQDDLLATLEELTSVPFPRS
ncbi:SDR family NAD(P)-dependent oxidoreductase [Streptomyces sp. J2-1]|uniref:SDR family NAD(P)-dependent oxidoreductase n=1 Tax=Streptomyces corallincola TaxID=2851888 RepID=UPI001C385632|nr:SDR family NAD(P)-dependent oxidoreductase [Streptomyces corallincola]MBV2353851.1 SDR family NAD(P)-dependent oxidoreductase [Streptomyces corallincola]